MEMNLSSANLKLIFKDKKILGTWKTWKEKKKKS